MEVTHGNESFTRGWQGSGEDRPTLHFSRAESNGFGSSRFKTPPMESHKPNFVQDALSNSLILKEIFTFLNDEDLESCYHVCQDWRCAADPFISPQYDITIKRNFHSCSILDKFDVFVEEKDRYNRKIVTQRTVFSGFTQILNVLLNQKVSIGLSLWVRGYEDIQDDKVMNFISKIGPLVLNLDMHGMEMNVVDVCKLLLQKFPNLKKLNCCGFSTRPQGSEAWIDDQGFNPDLPENKHKQLRIISFGGHVYRLSSHIETILKICPNLVEIQDFPLRMIDAIVVTQKVPALKSLCDMALSPDYWRWGFDKASDAAGTALRKLAPLQPKLKSLEFNQRLDTLDYHPYQCQRLRPYLFSVLQSSHESLESLVISALDVHEIQHFPPLTGLKELKLIPGFNEEAAFFPAEMALVEIFPNVSKIILDSDWGKEAIKRLLPKNLPNKIRAQINQLSIDVTEGVSCMAMLSRRFPFIQHLQIRIGAMHFTQRLLQLSRLWPQLKSLAVSVDFFCVNYKKGCVVMWMGRGPLRLDRVFTGRPKKVIEQLEDPAKKKYFTEEQIQGFKDRSVIWKFKELKEFKLFLSGSSGDYEKPQGEPYIRLSPVVNEFGFNLRPELKVTVDIQNVHGFAEEIQRDLEPLALCSNIEIVDDSFDIE